MSLRRVTPDPYIIMHIHSGDELCVKPFTRDALEIEHTRANSSHKSVRFVISLVDLRQLATEGERLVLEKVQNLDRERYGVALVVRQ